MGIPKVGMENKYCIFREYMRIDKYKFISYFTTTDVGYKFQKSNSGFIFKHSINLHFSAEILRNFKCGHFYDCNCIFEYNTLNRYTYNHCEFGA